MPSYTACHLKAMLSMLPQALAGCGQRGAACCPDQTDRFTACPDFSPNQPLECDNTDFTCQFSPSRRFSVWIRDIRVGVLGGMALGSALDTDTFRVRLVGRDSGVAAEALVDSAANTFLVDVSALTHKEPVDVFFISLTTGAIEIVGDQAFHPGTRVLNRALHPLCDLPQSCSTLMLIGSLSCSCAISLYSLPRKDCNVFGFDCTSSQRCKT